MEKDVSSVYAILPTLFAYFLPFSYSYIVLHFLNVFHRLVYNTTDRET